MTIERTPRVGLIQPVEGTGEKVKVGDINLNMTAIDTNIGAILVNDGVAPDDASLFDGAIVKERTSGITWVAQRNNLGGYDKKYIQYPYVYSSFTPSRIIGINGSYQTYGCDTFRPDVSVNSADGERSHPDNGWVCPRTGIYLIHHRYVWGNNGSGGTTESIGLINGAGQFNDMESCVQINPLGITTNELTIIKLVAKNDFYVFQLRRQVNTLNVAVEAFFDATALALL